MASPQLRPVPPPPRPPPPPPRVRAQAPGPPWRDWNTLEKLWASIYLIWALDALLLMTAVIGAQVHRDAVKTVGQDTAPSIIHAQHIKTALADMDANAVNELLGEPGATSEAGKPYEKGRIEAAKALIEAARNTTDTKNLDFDDAKRKAIEAIQVAMGTYEARVQQARDLHQRADATAVTTYRDAARLMDGELLAKSDELDKINHDELEKAYHSLSGRSAGSGFLILLVGAGMLWAMFSVQRFLNQRTHRILNPLLLASTLLTLAFVFYTFTTFGSERDHLRVAKQDAFDSIHFLLRAQAVAYAANADQGRYLLDTAHAREHEAAFNIKADLLAKLSAGTTFNDVMETVKQGQKVAEDRATGELVKELNNITFEAEGERGAAVKTFTKFGEYLKIDKNIRQLQESGSHAGAVKLAIGTQPGDSNWAFDQFDTALAETVAINQNAFDIARAQAFDSLSYFELKAAIIALIIAILAFFGLLQRIQEYR